MPVRTDGTVSAVKYDSALRIPGTVLETLKRDPRSNILFAKLEKYRTNGHRPQQDEFWIVCSTSCSSSGSSQPSVDFVLACTDGVIGKYPIFIYGTRFTDELTDEYLDLRMRIMARELTDAVDSRRVYSIFAVERVAMSFARYWTSCTGIRVVKEPYYAAKFSYCTEPLLDRAALADRSVNMRPADEHDTHQVARLCHGFAADSLWVLKAQQAHGWVVACIVALTRANATVTAITKVYTPPEFRGRGYAHRLVREVCNDLFTRKHKQHVVLYVGHTNSAAKVYNRVGFTKMVESWLELGFDRTKVDLGHW
ncbi:hypothetical protein DFH11DRAFT_1690153 [Phellopilus nigrolimitatus]|nr:hypothetical protein DFH11DRAFT_1690153 [Phellopilus nigrolimitatus]